MELIKRKLNELNLTEKVNLEFAAVDLDDQHSIINYKKKVNENSPWDLILVDGLEESYLNRIDCIKEAKNNLNKNGMIILDDSWRNEYKVVPEMLNDFKRLEFIGLGPARWGVTKTDVYIKK